MVEKGNAPLRTRRRIATMVMSLAAQGQRTVKVFALLNRLQRSDKSLLPPPVEAAIAPSPVPDQVSPWRGRGPSIILTGNRSGGT
jgi:hypothetical protein